MKLRGHVERRKMRIQRRKSGWYAHRYEICAYCQMKFRTKRQRYAHENVCRHGDLDQTL